jgi:hypothetical protein
MGGRGEPRKLQFQHPFPYEDEPVSVIYGNNHPPTHIHVKGKAVPVTGRGGPQGCEMLRFPHSLDLDNRLTDGGEASLTHRLPLTPRTFPGNSFLSEAESTPGPQCGWRN